MYMNRNILLTSTSDFQPAPTELQTARNDLMDKAVKRPYVIGIVSPARPCTELASGEVQTDSDTCSGPSSPSPSSRPETTAAPALEKAFTILHSSTGIDLFRYLPIPADSKRERIREDTSSSRGRNRS